MIISSVQQVLCSLHLQWNQTESLEMNVKSFVTVGLKHIFAMVRFLTTIFFVANIAMFWLKYSKIFNMMKWQKMSQFIMLQSINNHQTGEKYIKEE